MLSVGWLAGIDLAPPQEQLEARLSFPPGKHDIVPAALTLQLDVSTQPGDQPAVGAAGVGFFKLDDIIQPEILNWRHADIVRDTRDFCEGWVSFTEAKSTLNKNEVERAKEYVQTCNRIKGKNFVDAALIVSNLNTNGKYHEV